MGTSVLSGSRVKEKTTPTKDKRVMQSPLAEDSCSNNLLLFIFGCLGHLMHGVCMQCFYCPVVRHLWWWLGGRPASASVMHAMLERGHSVLVCPGGVQECLYMKHGREAVYLTKRTGFVRIALQHGAPSQACPRPCCIV